MGRQADPNSLTNAAQRCRQYFAVKDGRALFRFDCSPGSAQAVADEHGAVAVLVSEWQKARRRRKRNP